LKNIIERALIDSEGATIEPRHLHLLQRAIPAIPAVTAAAAPAAPKDRENRVADLPLNLAEAEELLIQRALQQTEGNIADAARLLGVHRTRIYRKLAQEAPAT